ncbi:MAG: type IV pilin protein [Rhodocyclaceae bacterium]|nr:type IV pilin protein [Rhodocyclaceae bacterium]
MNVRNSAAGFTLIEVMIVVAIIGILSAVAYPSYTEYVLRSKRNECSAQMMGMASALERRFSTLGRYDTGGTPGGFGCPADGGTATYTVVPVLTASTFAITATPQGGQTKDSCGNLTLDETGTKGVSKSTVAACWH